MLRNLEVTIVDKISWVTQSFFFFFCAQNTVFYLHLIYFFCLMENKSIYDIYYTTFAFNDINNQMIVAAEPFDSSKRKGKLWMEESDLLLPLHKHFSPSSNMEYAEWSYAMEPQDTSIGWNLLFCICHKASLYMFKESIYVSKSSSSCYATSSIEQYCYKVNHKTQEDVKDFFNSHGIHLSELQICGWRSSKSRVVLYCFFC